MDWKKDGLAVITKVAGQNVTKISQLCALQKIVVTIGIIVAQKHPRVVKNIMVA